jgi:hypothetical protein
MPKKSFTVSAADLGYDPRIANVEVELPESFGDGPVDLIVDHERTGASTFLRCENRAEALGTLKKYGYRVRGS